MRISTATLQETGIANLMLHQIQMNRSQEELSSGLRLLKPSDDPAAMANVLDTKAAISINTRYQQNISAVKLRLSNEDTALESAENLLNRVRELTVTGLNATYNASDRGAISKEIDELTGALLDIGNTQNDRGEYIFSGSLSKSKPFDFDNTQKPPQIAYRGDTYQRKVQIGPDIFMADSHNGFSIFQDIPTADTTITSNTTPSTTTDTTATEATDDGTVTDLATDTVSADDTATPTDDTATPTDSGTDSAAASATTTAIPTRSIFNTLLKLKETFNSALADSDFHKVTSAALKDLDTGLLRLGDTRVEVGARLNTLDQQDNILGKFILDSKQNLSNLQDADYAATISHFTQQQTALQASQQAFVKVKGLSLFNYL